MMHQALVMSGRASEFTNLGRVLLQSLDRLLKEVMAMYRVDRAAAKNLFIRLLYLGDVQSVGQGQRWAATSVL